MKKLLLFLILFSGIYFFPTHTASGESCCIPKGPNASARYESAVEAAVNQFINENPDVASKTGGVKSAMSQFLTGVAAILSNQGFNAGEVRNCGENHTSNDSLIVGQSSDTYGDRYDMLKNYETNQIKNSDPTFWGWSLMDTCSGSYCGSSPSVSNDDVSCEEPENPPPASNFSCVSGDDGSKYCSYDATGKYTTSNCNNVCPPLPPNVVFACKSGNQCIASKTGYYADLASCSKYCSSSVVSAGPPEITKIQPVEARINAQIEVYGKNLSEKIQLISTVDQSVADITGIIADATRELIKFDVPSVPAGVYQVSVFGWGDYADKSAVSPQNLTIKEGGDNFSGTTTLGVPEGYQSLGELITFIFAWSLRLLGISVFVMFFYAGVLWMTAAGNTGQVGEAKKRMTNAVLGAILLLSAYLILYTVNPDLVGGEWTLPGIGQEQP